jgi:hypothetical protein
MRPRSPVVDCLHRCGTYAVTPRKFALRHYTFQRTNHSGFLLIQLRVAILRPAHRGPVSIRIGTIFNPGSIDQIDRRVVCAVSVQVPHFFADGPRSDERFRYERMYGARFTTA